MLFHYYSDIDTQAFKEIIGDQHTVVVACGIDIARILIRAGFKPIELVETLVIRKFVKICPDLIMVNKMTSKKLIKENDVFDTLYFQRDSEWMPLPGWAKFFLKFGFALSQYKQRNTRYVTALAVPTRLYASSLIAAGLVHGKSLQWQQSVNNEHMAMLIALEEGTPVIFRSQKRKYRAKKQEIIVFEGKTYIGLKIEEYGPDLGKSVYVPEEDNEHIDILNADTVRLPKRQEGRKIVASSDLVKALHGDDRAFDFIEHTNIEAVIIGTKKMIGEEINTSLAITQVSDHDCRGYLSDLIRIREFLPPGAAYRSIVLPSTAANDTSALKGDPPSAVIFDGPAGFVKWRDYWRSYNWVIILDETDPNFKYATSQVNQEFLSRAEKQHRLKIPIIHPAIEVTFFSVEEGVS